MDKPLTVREVARLVDGTVEGDGSVSVAGVASIASAGPGEITFAADGRHAADLGDSSAGAAIVGESPATAPMPLIRVGSVEAAVAKLLDHLADPEDTPPVGRDASAVVAVDAEIAADAAVGAGVTVGPRASVGAGTVLCANVSVGAGARIGANCMLAEGVVVRANCRLGDRVRIGPNSVIGWDGFGYYFADGVHHKITHAGNVVIEDDVEIGACSCVDRAKFGSTRIGAGTKIDNLVQVAHNVRIGRGCILVGQCGIAGSAALGDFVVIGGNAGIRDNISLGDGVQCSAFAAVASDIPDGEIVAGTPARPYREALRIAQASAKLPQLLKRVKDIEKRLSALEPPEDNQQARDC